MIDVTLLGTAALMPLPQRALAAALLTCGGHSILFDCGEGTQTAARKAGVSLMKTDVIALTHFHGDHIFGLPGLLQTMNVQGRTERLFITGPKGLRRELGPILKLVKCTMYDIELIALPAGGLALASLVPGWSGQARLSAFPTLHTVPSQGYCFTLGRAGAFLPERAKALGVPQEQWGRLQHGGRVRVGKAVIRPEQVTGLPRKGLKCVFSGDTAACEPLIEAAREADLLICEGTFGGEEHADAAARHGHMTFSQAAGVAARAGTKRLWLTHFSQTIDDPEAILPLAQAIFPNTVCGRDGLSETLRFEK
ncbi:MAG: ribonuclease Z [Clostridia bacterium]|nr:ribonuclease Z [Clostridia bacterium]